jgi:peptidoglycan/LPS O-acetylase OafA/YrhL
LSIWIVVGILSLLLAGHAASLLALLLGKPLPRPWPEFLLAVFLVTFQIAGLVRMSRWPVIVQTVMVLGNVAIQYATNPHWTDRYPIFGPFAVIIPLVAYLACTLPHWRKMNWAVFGRPYSPPENQVEVFT